MTHSMKASSLALLASLIAAAPDPLHARPSSVQQHILPNGLEVLLLEEPGREIASVQVWYRVGLREEDAETVGLAHLLEHLMFTGTAANPDFHVAVAARGGRAFSGPWEDLTYFTNDVPRAAVTQVLALESDRMRGLTLSATAIQESLADVELEESAAATRWGPDEIAGAMREAAFAGHPYGAPRRAPAKSVATTEQCRAFYERFYGPDRACIVVAGGFETDSVLAAITAHFGELPPTGNPRPPLPPPPSIKERRQTVTGTGLPGARWIALGYLTPSTGAPEADAMSLLASHLSVDAADSLTAALLPSGERLLTSIVTCRLDEFESRGLLTVMAPLPDGTDEDSALDALAGAVARASQSALDAENFATLRDRARLERAASATTVRERAIALALAHLRGGRPRTPAGADSALGAVQWEQVSQVAAAYLRPDQALGLRIHASGAPPGGSTQ